MTSCRLTSHMYQATNFRRMGPITRVDLVTVPRYVKT